MNSIFDERKLSACVTAFYAISLPEYHMHMHAHHSCEIMYVVNGSCIVQCEDKEVTLTQNQFIFIDADVPHKLSIHEGKPCSILNIEFLCQFRKTGINLVLLRENSGDFRTFCEKKNSYMVSGDLRSLGYALKDLITYLQKNEEETDYLLDILFQRVMLELAYSINQNKKSTGLYYLKKACSYIEDNLFDSMRVPEIANYVGINKSYLQLLFSRFLHCTITEYINQKRMEQAVFLLINSSASITDIAFSTGYNSRQHFAYIFEKHYQMSPQKYRKLHLRTLVPDTEQKQYVIDNSNQRKTVCLKDTKVNT